MLPHANNSARKGSDPIKSASAEIKGANGSGSPMPSKYIKVSLGGLTSPWREVNDWLKTFLEMSKLDALSALGTNFPKLATINHLLLSSPKIGISAFVTMPTHASPVMTNTMPIVRRR